MALAACRTTGMYRSVDLPHSPHQARNRVVRELEAKGYRITSTTTDRRRVTITAAKRQSSWPPAKPPATKKPPGPPSQPATKKPPGPPTQTATKKPLINGPTLTAVLSPHKTGTRLLLHSQSSQSFQLLFPKLKHRTYKVGFGLNGRRLLWEAYSASGYRYAPSYGGSLAVEAGARIGYRFIHLGGGDDTPEPQVSVGLALGLGGGVSGTDKGGYALPSLTLSYLIRRTVEPIGGTVIPLGPEFSLDLHAVGILSPRRAGLEGQLVLRYSDIIGVYVGAGYQWLPTRGATFTAGLYLSTVGIAMAALLGALAL